MLLAESKIGQIYAAVFVSALKVKNWTQCNFGHGKVSGKCPQIWYVNMNTIYEYRI